MPTTNDETEGKGNYDRIVKRTIERGALYNALAGIWVQFAAHAASHLVTEIAAERADAMLNEFQARYYFVNGRWARRRG